MKSVFRNPVGMGIIALSLSVTATGTVSGEYMGEYCWNFTNTLDGEQTSGQLRLGVEHIGGSHYLCSGLVTVTSPLSLKVPVFGNAELIDGKIHVMLLSKGIKIDDHGQTVGIDMSSIVLDPATMTGVSQGIGVYYDGNTLFSGSTSTSTGCP